MAGLSDELLELRERVDSMEAEHARETRVLHDRMDRVVEILRSEMDSAVAELRDPPRDGSAARADQEDADEGDSVPTKRYKPFQYCFGMADASLGEPWMGKVRAEDVLALKPDLSRAEFLEIDRAYRAAQAQAHTEERRNVTESVRPDGPPRDGSAARPYRMSDLKDAGEPDMSPEAIKEREFHYLWSGSGPPPESDRGPSDLDVANDWARYAARELWEQGAAWTPPDEPREHTVETPGEPKPYYGEPGGPFQVGETTPLPGADRERVESVHKVRASGANVYDEPLRKYTDQAPATRADVAASEERVLARIESETDRIINRQQEGRLYMEQRILARIEQAQVAAQETAELARHEVLARIDAWGTVAMHDARFCSASDWTEKDHTEYTAALRALGREGGDE